ncbi:hypothetical protein C4J81_17730 [Deltaproteobacteria bacterium Smac51]|nr:hypothetical protein C4J81_17730 [Deltaproteobacteria bacterium Smac51]
MKAWLPVLVEELAGNPVLALSNVRNLARAAVFSRDGDLLAGGLGSPSLQAQAAEEARLIAPGECRLLTEPSHLTLECLSSDDDVAGFWKTALQNQEGAWASWLLTMPMIEDGTLKMARHLLSAFGPWTTPRMPEELADQWSLLPLKAGLGRLFILGDDALALETAALAARTGLTVTWISAEPQDGPDLEEALNIGDFDYRRINSWESLALDELGSWGLKEGVRLLVTTSHHESFLEPLKDARLAWLALSGEAEGCDGCVPAGLFPKAVTTSQKALGLVAQMLGK